MSKVVPTPYIYLEHFDRFSSNFELELIWKRSVLELHMAFCLIAKELWPLIRVQNCISLNIF